MDSWPADFRNSQNESSSIRKGKRPEKARESPTKPYPVLEHGLIGEGALVESNGRLEWTSLGPIKNGEYDLNESCFCLIQNRFSDTRKR